MQSGDVCPEGVEVSKMVKLLGWFEDEAGEVCEFDSEHAARTFADGVFHGAAQYGCGSVVIYIQTDGEIINVEGEPIEAKRMAALIKLFKESE